MEEDLSTAGSNAPGQSTQQDPARVSDDAAHSDPSTDSPLGQTLSCSDVTGLDCDYIAKPDESAEWADRGDVSEQILAQITTHVGKRHPDKVLSPAEIDNIRDKITGGRPSSGSGNKIQATTESGQEQMGPGLQDASSVRGGPSSGPIPGSVSG